MRRGIRAVLVVLTRKFGKGLRRGFEGASKGLASLLTRKAKVV